MSNLNQEFYNACCKGDLQAAEQFLKAGADVNDIRGAALRIAIRHGKFETAAFLLSKKADHKFAMDDVILRSQPEAFRILKPYLKDDDWPLISNLCERTPEGTLREVLIECADKLLRTAPEYRPSKPVSLENHRAPSV